MASSMQAELVDRLRALFDAAFTREVSMFGGLAFMVDQKLVVSARRAGDLLVRIPKERFDELTSLPGVSEAVMGRDRVMGRNWVAVSAKAVAADADLSRWVEIARSSASGH
ncbi:TfoX/Sxy family protein [Gordonia neofelifaecis]|uniref:TfoX N-terminal domain-containing protein n=1 Tax=Gordonia neofelifaecis NRRL B-59395 TaxID=644548 RepID=F1YLB1_9ACTN|nr:TfoX/Sxy family protein [Gordonia neofelifaecis]EGD54571.1 hypothetical protein SCNU_13353 [Gordonia neofelifaecis NRRL B-59395]